MRQEKFVSKFKETITDMNNEYRNLLWAYKVKDCRVEYLWTFEQALSLNLNFPLWENPRYIRVTYDYPLPEEGYTSLQKFKLYMMLYYYIMSDAGLLNREAEAEASQGINMGAFMRGLARWRPRSTRSSWTAS